MKLRYSIPTLLLAAPLLFCQDAPPAATGSTGSTGEKRPHRFDKRWGGGRLGRSGATGPGAEMRPPFPPPGRGPGGPSGRHGFPPMFDTLAAMSPEDRNKALASDPHFQRMPPQHQAALRERLERYAAMTPEQRQQMRDRFDIMNSMAPENRDRVREVFPRWKHLPPERQQAVRAEFHTLSQMTPAEREKRFNDAEFQKSFAPREQQLLKDLSANLR